jgi:hypothetical protein
LFLVSHKSNESTLRLLIRFRLNSLSFDSLLFACQVWMSGLKRKRASSNKGESSAADGSATKRARYETARSPVAAVRDDEDADVTMSVSAGEVQDDDGSEDDQGSVASTPTPSGRQQHAVSPVALTLGDNGVSFHEEFRLTLGQAHMQNGKWLIAHEVIKVILAHGHGSHELAQLMLRDNVGSAAIYGRNIQVVVGSQNDYDQIAAIKANNLNNPHVEPYMREFADVHLTLQPINDLLRTIIVRMDEPKLTETDGFMGITLAGSIGCLHNLGAEIRERKEGKDGKEAKHDTEAERRYMFEQGVVQTVLTLLRMRFMRDEGVIGITEASASLRRLIDEHVVKSAATKSAGYKVTIQQGAKKSLLILKCVKPTAFLKQQELNKRAAPTRADRIPKHITPKKKVSGKGRGSGARIGGRSGNGRNASGAGGSASGGDDSASQTSDSGDESSSSSSSSSSGSGGDGAAGSGSGNGDVDEKVQTATQGISNLGLVAGRTPRNVARVTAEYYRFVLGDDDDDLAIQEEYQDKVKQQDRKVLINQVNRFATGPKQLPELQSTIDRSDVEALGESIGNRLLTSVFDGDESDGKEGKAYRQRMRDQIDPDLVTRSVVSLNKVQNQSVSGLHLARVAKGRWLLHLKNHRDMSAADRDRMIGHTRATSKRFERMAAFCELYPGAVALDIPYAWFDSGSAWMIKMLTTTLDLLEDKDKVVWTQVPQWVTNLQRTAALDE